ncbi:MAG: hypothetical protein RLZZ518_724 [Actinomycetota bacterium]|jgi:hypothetical protein
MAAIQIKDVPSELHKKARLRARNLDLTLGDYVLSLIRRDMDRGEVREWRAALLERPVTQLPADLVLELIREGRK